MDLPLALPPGTSCWTGESLDAQLHEVVDEIGARSAKAQGIKNPFTSASKLIDSDHRLHVVCNDEGTQMLGFIKIGTKHLYYYAKDGSLTEMDPLCVLDFYVHESCQRMGLGQTLINGMLNVEGVAISELAWDNPSPSSFGLLRKHYGLSEYVDQPNHYVLFSQYFER
mmetsp:Transcript_4821/g.10402  ORF Transcript_4821/g.10402 Transcript_4821/m.10402 type:complete len:168 (+) Transcript_4821:102-605(+)